MRSGVLRRIQHSTWTTLLAKEWTAAILFALSAQTFAAVNVVTQHNNRERSGANLQETVLTPANVNVKQFGMLFRHVVDDQVYGQPLIVTNIQIGGGTHDVVYVTTVSNSVYAFDANDEQASGPLWHVNFGTPPNVNDGNFGCLDMNGNMGITGTPVIDVNTETLYVVTDTRLRDGFVQRLHALDLATGTDLDGSPVDIQAPQFNALMENQRPALAEANGQIYVGYSSHCDKEPYHGFLFAFDAKTLRQTAVFNTTPGGSEGSIWQSGQAPAVDDQGSIYVVTANGTWDGTQNFGESFLKFDPHLNLLDWFTPPEHDALDAKDADVDSSGAMLIPGTHEVIDGGKQGVLYVVNTDKMGHLGGDVQHFQATGSHLHSIVYWDGAKNGPMIYIWGQRDHLRAYRFNGRTFIPEPFQMRPEANQGHPGAMLSLSANANKDGILWAAIHASGDSWHESRPGVLHAYAADDIMHELWNSLQDSKRDDCGNYSKMAPPTIANEKVYLPSFGTENVGSGQFCVYGLLPGGPPPAAPTGLAAAASAGRVDLSWNRVASATTYTISKASGARGSFLVIARGVTTPAFEDKAVRQGTKYTYEVRAGNSNGESAASNQASAEFAKPIKTGVPH